MKTATALSCQRSPVFSRWSKQHQLDYREEVDCLFQDLIKWWCTEGYTDDDWSIRYVLRRLLG